MRLAHILIPALAMLGANAAAQDEGQLGGGQQDGVQESGEQADQAAPEKDVSITDDEQDTAPPTPAARDSGGAASRAQIEADFLHVLQRLSAPEVLWPQSGSGTALPPESAAGATLGLTNNMLQSRQAATRMRAIDALAQAPGQQGLEVLLNALVDQDPAIRDRAAEILVRREAEQVFGWITQVMLRNNPAILSRLDTVLPKLSPLIKDPMMAVLRNGSEPAQRHVVAAYALGIMRSEEAADLLFQRVWSAHPLLAVTSARALLAIVDAASKEQFYQMTRHPITEVRQIALNGLVKRWDRDALDILIEIAQGRYEPQLAIRVEAVRHIAEVGTHEVVPVLIDLMRRAPEMRNTAHQALVQITNVDLGDQPRLWAQWYARVRQASGGPRQISSPQRVESGNE